MSAIVNISHKNTSHHQSSYPFWYTHHLKENWPINFSSVLYAYTEILSKRNSLSPLQKRKEFLMPTMRVLLFLFWENFTSINVKSYEKLAVCLRPRPLFLLKQGFGKSIRCDNRSACKMHHPRSKLWCVLAPYFSWIKIQNFLVKIWCMVIIVSCNIFGCFNLKTSSINLEQ